MTLRNTRSRSFSDDDLLFMKRALTLAEMGRGQTSPNPTVGAVLVRSGKIIGEGFHRAAGKPHAEIEAIADARKKGHRIAGSTLYVTLEPCCHLGRTSPCTETIIAEKISRVVYPCKDPDHRVSGKGGRMLAKAGIRVDKGICKEETEALLASYFHNKKTQSSYVTVKLATSLDGAIATAQGESKWITGESARAAGRELRGEIDAVIVGSRTAERDDPALTTRISKKRNPYRIVVCGDRVLSQKLTLITSNADSKTILAVPAIHASRYRKFETRHGVAVWSCKSDRKGDVNLQHLMKKCWEFGFCSILVEGGGDLIASFLKEKLVNEWHQFLSPKIIGGGKQSVAAFSSVPLAKRPRLLLTHINLYGEDIELAGNVEYPR